MLHRSAFVLVVFAIGCDDPSWAKDVPDETMQTGTTWPGNPDPEPVRRAPSPEVGGSTGAAAQDGIDDDGLGFISFRDGGPIATECDIYSQDCAVGEKCMPYANDGGSAWNATGCFAIAADPVGKNESCSNLGNGVDGLDTCDIGLMCWDVDEQGEGMCVPFCSGSADNPTCEDPGEECSTGKTFQLCLPACHPLGDWADPACPVGCACYPMSDTFFCAPDASGELGQQGDPCEFINACDPGHACVGADALSECVGAVGCCTSYCDLEQNTCASFGEGLECVPWFTPGMAPPGMSSIGICAVPS